MSFDPLRNPVDHIVLAGQRSPGLATIEDADTPRDFQERRGFGISFATLRFRGVGLAEFKVLLRLTTEQDWDDWHAWRGLVARPTQEAQPRAGQIFPRLHAPPMDIEHPILADLAITSAVVTNLVQPRQTGDGEWTIEIHFKEYRARVLALEETAGSRVVDSNADRAVDAEIEANRRTIAALESPEGLAGL